MYKAVIPSAVTFNYVIFCNGLLTPTGRVRSMNLLIVFMPEN